MDVVASWCEGYRVLSFLSQLANPPLLNRHEECINVYHTTLSTKLAKFNTHETMVMRLTYAYDHKTYNTTLFYEVFFFVHLNMIAIPYVTMLGRYDFCDGRMII